MILIVFEKRRSLLKLLMIFCLGYSLFLIPKVLSGRLLNSTSSTKTKVISSLTRMNYSTLVADNKEELLLLYLEVAIDGRAERINNFKKKFYEINVNNFNLYFHKIGTYSGIAIPLQVVFFNSIGYLAVPFLILLILVSFYLVKYAYISSSKFKSFTALFFSYCILGSFFEDINSISRFTDYSIVMIYFFVTTFDIKKGIFTDSQNKYFVQ